MLLLNPFDFRPIYFSFSKNLGSPAVADRFLTTAPPGKP